MSTGQTYNQAPAPVSVVGLHIRCDETFETRLPRPWRLRLYERRLDLPEPLKTTNDLSGEDRGKLALWLDALKRNPRRRDAALRAVAAELAPDAAQVAAVTLSADRCQQARANLSNLETALALLDRLGEVTHDARFAVGDAGLILLSLAPEAKPADVLAEHLRGRERDQIRALLCPSFPPLDGLPLDLALRFEQSSVREWLTCCRVSERVPQEFRDTFPGLGYGFFRAAALTTQLIDGKRRQPTREEIARRLGACCDNEALFLAPADLRRWALSGAATLPDRTAVEKPDRLAEFVRALRLEFAECDSLDGAVRRLAGPGGAWKIGGRRA